MKATKYTRHGKNIVNVQNDEPTNEQHESISLAKKASFKLQMKLDGALGRGSVKAA